MFRSIKARWLLATLVSIPLLLIAVGSALEKSHRESLLSGIKTQLTLHVYALISSADIEGNSIWMPEGLAEERFNQIDSGLFAAIYRQGREEAEWSSISARGALPPGSPSLENFNAAQIRFGESIVGADTYFRLAFDVIWEGEDATAIPLRFAVYQSSTEFNVQLSSYTETLWFWMVLTVSCLVSIQLGILYWGMKPFAEMARDLDKIREGESNRLDGDYPRELESVVGSVNLLLEHENSLRERYRNTMSNLAHSIKTPLAIIKGELGTKQNEPSYEELATQTERVDQIISYQLKRAVGAANPLGPGIDIKPICEKIVKALKKAYREQDYEVSMALEDLSFRGDEGDFYELMGNLLENAFKYGGGSIRLEAFDQAGVLTITVEDDGDGIPEEMVGFVTQRGARADSSLPGQGIGLSIVVDIVSSYGGEITFGAALLGGTRVEVKF